MTNQIRNTALLLCGSIVLLAGCTTVPESAFDEPVDRVEAWEQDLSYLLDVYPQYNQSFEDESRAEFERIISATRDQAGDLSDNEIYVRLLRSLMTAEDAHTSMSLSPFYQKIRRIPVRMSWFQDGMFVIQADEEHANLLGAKVLSLGPATPEEAMAELRTIVPGNESAVRYAANYFFSSPDFLEGLGILDDPDRMQLVVETPAGERVERTVNAVPFGDVVRGHRTWRELSPASTEGVDSPGFLHVLDGVELPEYLAVPNQSSFARAIADGTVLYVQINANYDLNGKLSDTLADAGNIVSSGSIRAAVVDLRFNTGGNFLSTSGFVRNLPMWLDNDEPIYIVTGGPTLSAGIITAARLKYYGGDRALIAGEPSAEGLRFWAESLTVTLPNSGLRLWAAYRYHDWSENDYVVGDRSFYLARWFGVPAGDLDVDLPAEPTFAEYAAGRDPVIDAILADLAAR